MSGGDNGGGSGAGAQDAGKTSTLRDTYSGVLGTLTTADFTVPDGPEIAFTGDFEYATADLNADTSPELLVKAKGSEFSAVRVYGATKDGTPVAPTKLFYEGASSAGGARAALYSASDGRGLLASDWMGGTGAASSALWIFDGSEMTETGQVWDYRIDQVPSDLAALQSDITWTPSGDSSALATLNVGGTTGSGSSGSGPQPTTAVGNGSIGGAPGSAGSTGTLPQNATAPASQVGGTCGTVDGATVTAGDNTTCGFAMNVAQQALQPVYAKDGSGYAGVASVTASSPTTGTSYTMQCGIGSAGGTSTCSGGNNAVVRMEKFGNGSLLYLVN